MTNKHTHYQHNTWSIVGTEQQATHIIAEPTTMTVPLIDSGMVIFILEPSVAYDQIVLTLPSGIIQSNETPLQTADRSLAQGLGYSADKINFLGKFHPQEKYLYAPVWTYLVRQLKPLDLMDYAQNIETQLAPLDQFERLMDNGSLHDPAVIVSLYLARQVLLGE
jgi:ADP-ribose pyrophosphatase YjhB (NUDIX family)